MAHSSIQNFTTSNKATLRVFHSHVEAALGHKAAVVLQQILYLQCIKSTKYGTALEETLVYNTYKQWCEDYFPFISTRTLMRIIKFLEEEGLLMSTQPYACYGSRTKYYSVNIALFKEMFGEIGCLKKANKEKPKEAYNHCQNGNTYCQNGNIIYVTETTNKDISSSIEKSTFKKTKSEEFLSVLKSNFQNKTKQTQHGLKSLLQLPNEEEVDKILHMLVDWFNYYHKHALKPIKMYLNSKTKLALIELWYGDVIGQDIEKWKQFAIAANTSKFVMGEKKTERDFKANMAWLLKEDNVIALLNGDHGVGDRELDRDRVTENIILAEKELTASAAKQVTNHIASNVEINKERKEFEEYVDDCINRRNEDKEDKYGMKFEFENYQVTWMTKAKGLPLSEKQMKQINDAFYERYLSKKHLGRTKHEVQKMVAQKIERLKESVGSQSELLCRLKELLSEVQCRGVEMFGGGCGLNQSGFSLAAELN